MAKAKYGYRPKNKMARMFFGIGITALLLEIIIFVHLAATENFALLKTAYSYLLDAMSCNFAGLQNEKVAFLIILSAVVFYLGIITALTILILALVKKRHKAIIGSVSSLIVSLFATFDLAVISTYLFTDIALSGVISVIFFIMFIMLIIMWVISSSYCIKYCLAYRYNWETNFVIGENGSGWLNKGTLQEIDREIVNVMDMDDDELDLYGENSQIGEEQPVEEVKEEPTEIVEEQHVEEEPEEEYDEELAHLEDEMEEDEDDNLEDPDEDDDEEVPAGFPKFERKRLTFAERIRRCKKDARENYKEIRKYFESIGFRSKITKTGNSYLYKNTKYAVITTSGKTGLKIYFKLNLEDYENSPIPLKDKSDVKKYEKTPAMLRVKSKLSVKRAKKLMDEIRSKLD